MRNHWRRFKAMQRDALAAGSRRAKTPQAVECEASQSGAESATPNPSNPIPPIQCEES